MRATLAGECLLLITLMEDFQKTMGMIQYKCWYYDTAVEAGTEDGPKTMAINDLPRRFENMEIGF